MPEMSEEEREALQAEHTEAFAAQRIAESQELAENEAINYARTHLPPEKVAALDEALTQIAASNKGRDRGVDHADPHDVSQR